jgi:RNA polymerase sigma-70 factor (ECF subfamily)
MTGSPTSPQVVEKRPDVRAVFQAECGYVWKSLQRLGVRPADLEDTVHEVFITFHRRLDQYDSTRPIRPWLFAIAVRVASDYRKRAHRRYEVVGDEREVAGNDRPDDAAEINEKRRIVMAALERLEPDRRAVLILHDIDGVSMPDIANSLAIPLNTGYSRLRLARRDFATAVEERLSHASGAQ